MFHPPRCPNPGCPANRIERLGGPGRFEEQHRFYLRKGYYYPKCRARPVPRFECRVCRIRFSRQTFRHDYCDNKPHLNVRLFELLASGLGLRQSARILHLSRRCTELKARKISRHLGLLGHNLLDQFPRGCAFQMDEMETFENERRVCPLTLPIVIERNSMLVVAAQSAPIRPSGGMSSRRVEAIARYEEREGRREDQSRACLRRMLKRTSRLCRRLGVVCFDTDEKAVYPGLLRQAFGPRLVHQQFSSKLPRDTSNPLFRINLTNAMARDLNGRLRRRSWLASKRRQFLDLQLHVFTAYRNFVRPRFNGETESPAQRLGFVDRRLTPAELMGWRQDWGWFSSHPASLRAASIRSVRRRERSLSGRRAAAV